jgi:hypothetical protein
MTRHTLAKTLLLSMLALAWLVPAPAALADGMEVKKTRVAYMHYRLPPERHVIEGVRPPGSAVFLINGRYFTAASPSCMRWLPNERITLLAGDWHGYCDTAVFRNLSRGGTCTMWCR